MHGINSIFNYCVLAMRSLSSISQMLKLASPTVSHSALNKFEIMLTHLTCLLIILSGVNLVTKANLLKYALTKVFRAICRSLSLN